MKAAVLGASGIEVRDVAQPEPKPGEVLVKVRAGCLNRADLMATMGLRHGPAQGSDAPLGREFSGEVAAVGAGVKQFKPGDRVMCTGNGGFAEFAVADQSRVSAIPPNNMTFEQAAGLPVALQTMHDAVVTNGRLQAGESVLIQGASSGVGLMGMQIAKLKGARLVIGTSTNAARRARLKEYGADLALDSSDPGWVAQAVEASGGEGLDLIVDQVSAPVMNQNMHAAKILGRIVNVGRLGGFKGEFDFDLHALKRIDYIGVTFRTRTAEEVRVIVERMRADLWDAVEAGTLTLPIDRVFALDDAAAAYAHMKENKHFGKIVVAM